MLYGYILFIPEKSVEKVCSRVQNRFLFRISNNEKFCLFLASHDRIAFIPGFDENKKSLLDLIPKRVSYLNELRGNKFECSIFAHWMNQ